MAITYVGGASAIASGSTTVGITIPLNSGLTGGSNASISTGDLVIVSLAHGSALDTSMSLITGGYTELTEQYSNDVYDTNLAVFYKFVTSGTDTAVISANPGNAAYAQAMTVHVFRGAKTTSGITVVPATGISSGRPIIPDISTLANSVVLHIGAYANATSTLALSGTGLTDVRTATSPDTTAVSLLSGYKVQATEGTVTGQMLPNAGTNTNMSWAAAAVAIQQQPSNNSLTSTSITTGNPTLDNPTAAQVITGPYNLTATGITTGATTLDLATLVATSLLDSTSITTGNPTVDASTLYQTHILASVAITAGTPTLDAPTLTAVAGMNSLTALGITTGASSVGTSTVAQKHTLSNTNIVTGTPTAGITTIHVTSVLVSTNVATGAPTLGLPTLVDYAMLSAASLATGNPTVGETSVSQIHKFTSVAITTGVPELPLAIAFSQGSFNESYERKRTVWVMSESRVVTVSKDALPRVATAERENRTTIIQ